MTQKLHISFVDDEHVAAKLYPFCLSHCSWEVRCGIVRVWEKWQKTFPQATFSFVSTRQHVLAVFEEREQISSHTPAQCPKHIIIKGAVLPSPPLMSSVQDFLASPHAELHLSPRDVPDSASIVHLWDALSFSSAEIAADRLRLSDDFSPFTPGSPFIAAHNKDEIWCGKNVEIGDFCVLDASAGAIVIDDNAKIMHHSTIVGPCYIGKNSVVKIGSKIYGETTIGTFCKVGGEIENSILHNFSNKQHDGFLGHSYIGEWVNLGADTNTSDLKNNYGKISVFFPHETIKTGRMLLGILCGDHSKAGINTMFNTGTTIGFSANIFGGDYPAKFIPSFAWGGSDGTRFDLEKAMSLAATVKSRRKQQLLESEKELFRRIYEYN